MKFSWKRFTALLISFLMLAGLIAVPLKLFALESEAKKSEASTEKAGKLEKQEEESDYVAVEMKDGAVILLRLEPSAAPETVQNFKKLVKEHFYDGLIFHRVIDGFMIQGGDPLGTGTGGAKTTIKGEFAANGIENPLKHERGVISMARSADPNSASSQFFICNGKKEDLSHLDGNYAAFGRVISGMEEVDKIAKTPKDRNDRPLEDQVMKEVYFVSEASAKTLASVDPAESLGSSGQSETKVR